MQINLRNFCFTKILLLQLERFNQRVFRLFCEWVTLNPSKCLTNIDLTLENKPTCSFWGLFSTLRFAQDYFLPGLVHLGIRSFYSQYIQSKIANLLVLNFNLFFARVSVFCSFLASCLKHPAQKSPLLNMYFVCFNNQTAGTTDDAKCTKLDQACIVSELNEYYINYST